MQMPKDVPLKRHAQINDDSSQFTANASSKRKQENAMSRGSRDLPQKRSRCSGRSRKVRIEWN